MAAKKPQGFNFEKTLDDLSKLVEKMEQGNLPLEKSLEHYEQGIGLIKQAQQALHKAEQKVEVLTTKGKETLRAFEGELEDE